jgi:hypothetical protein
VNWYDAAIRDPRGPAEQSQLVPESTRIRVLYGLSEFKVAPEGTVIYPSDVGVSVDYAHVRTVLHVDEPNSMINYA